MELLSLLVEKYEQEHYPIEAPSPIEAIKFRMEQMNLKQADVAPLFGGKTRVSEVLNGKRPLTLKMITLFVRRLVTHWRGFATDCKELSEANPLARICNRPEGAQRTRWRGFAIRAYKKTKYQRRFTFVRCPTNTKRTNQLKLTSSP